MFLGSWITKIKLLIQCYSLDMQEVMQKRLAIVVMMVMTALKISLAVGFLLKNDILQISFLISFINFENHPPSPSLPLKKGLHRFLLNPLSPQGTGDLTGKPAVLYEQTSSRPKGLLVEFYAIELRLFMRRWRPRG